MKNIKLIIFILSFLLLSCSSGKNNSSISVQNEVLKIIIQTEKQLNEGKFWDNQKVDMLANMSLITPESSVNGHSAEYKVKMSHITQWKKWLDENKTSISYYQNEDVYKYYFQNRNEKIIRFEYEPNKFRFSISEQKMKYILETTKMIKERNNKTLQVSGRASN